MHAHAKISPSRNSNIVVRLAKSAEEIRHADTLVFQNYVADGFWTGEDSPEKHQFLRSPHRTTFVMLNGTHMVGTLSIIQDSSHGLPSDGTQNLLMNRLRCGGGSIAEVSAFAMDRSRTANRRLACLLMSYMYQYSFYYAGIDDLVASCKPAHAHFYESVLCFSKVSDLTYYQYSQASGYLISLDLLEAHKLFSTKYPLDPSTGTNWYRFYLCDPHPCHEFPTSCTLARPRAVDWLARSMREVA